MPNIDSKSHVRGESFYVDDIPETQGTLHAVIVYSTKVHAKFRINTDKAYISGVTKIITATDIIGENQIGNIFPDETLLAENIVEYIGEPIAIIIADSVDIGYDARKLVDVDYYEELEVITDPKIAFERGNLLFPKKVFSSGKLDWNCEYIVEDTLKIAGQEHLYLETQASYAYMKEKEKIKVIASTQSPTVTQKAICRVLGIPMHMVEVDIIRLGGAFGGKEDQATPFSCMAALGTYLTHKPVKLVLSRQDDLIITGKRHPYTVDYKIGMNKSGKLISFETIFYQNAGACADLSPAVLERTLFHATNTYYIPNTKLTGISAKTNLPPNTAFRGFGGPQGMFVIEAALHRLAKVSGLDYTYLQQLNMITDGEKFPYGQIMKNSSLPILWKKINTTFEKRKKEIKTFNVQHKYKKRGLAVFPLAFGISFTKTSLNQAGALIHIYTDGSVGISTGAVEMGQGVNTRLIQTVAHIFSIPWKKVKIETTNTTRVANASPSAASATHDLNGLALKNAADKLIDRLSAKAAEILGLSKDKITFGNGRVGSEDHQLLWEDLIFQCYESRIDLSAHGYYATPGINFDPITNKGTPFAYYAMGICVTTATVDCIRGTYSIDTVDVLHDVGEIMNEELDRGQIEGGVVQGIGWMTMEELAYDGGHLLARNLGTYKIPGLSFVPKINISFIEGVSNPTGLFHSKAIGEPPLMYGISAYFALINAMQEFQPNTLSYSHPLTPEKVLLGLWAQ